MKPSIKNLFFPLILFILSIIFFFYVEKYQLHQNIIIKGINYQDTSSILVWFFTTHFLSKLLKLFTIKRYEKKHNIKMPQLVKSLVVYIYWTISFVLLLGFYFEQDLTAIWTTSTVAIAIFGFAIRGMLLDLFSGIAMGLDRPFNIGDWIVIEDDTVGKVLSMNWRVTKIVTRDNIIKVIPNSLLSSTSFTNLGNHQFFREKIELELDYHITAHKAERILLGAANSIKELENDFKKPDVIIKDFTPRGVKWQLRFWLTDYSKKDTLDYKLKKQILKNLHFSNTTVSKDKIDINSLKRTTEEEKDEVEFLLKNIKLFETLTITEISYISKKSIRRLVLQDENIINVNETSNSFFILLEGSLSVLIPSHSGSLVEVAKIKPGEFFGEMSLLTNEPRSATIKADVDSVIYEIKQEHIKSIITSRSEIVEYLSEYLLNIQSKNQDYLKKLNEESNLNNNIKNKKYFLTVLKDIFFEAKP